MNIENRYARENNETEPRVDFVNFFSAKLEGISPIPNNIREHESKLFRVRDVGIDEIEKKGIALVFLTEDNPHQYELWLEDYKDIKDIDNRHHEAEENLKQFLEDKGLEFGARLSAIILEDVSGKIYLFVDQNVGDFIKSESTSADEKKIKQWTDLLERYQLEKIIGSFGGIRDGEKIESLLDFDFVGRQREDNYLRNFATKYNMTNNQFMRFRSLVKSMQAAKQSTNVDKIAQEILAEDKNQER